MSVLGKYSLMATNQLNVIINIIFAIIVVFSFTKNHTISQNFAVKNAIQNMFQPILILWSSANYVAKISRNVTSISLGLTIHSVADNMLWIITELLGERKVNRNIDEVQPVNQLKGEGGGREPFHRYSISGKVAQRYKDGCRKRHTCEGCNVPIDKCRG
jgi:hypothetical protein